MNQVSVGDPAVSSLSSCLCAFPGGFSLLTEAGLLRPFLVSDAAGQGSAAGEAAVVAATAIRLSEPSQEGSFPLGSDTPVDHSWSQDGDVLVVLRRFGYTVYSRLRPSPRKEERAPNGSSSSGRSSRLEEVPCRDRQSSNAPSLGLVEVHVGSNAFEGKVVACCSLCGPAATAAAATKSGVGGSGSGSGRAYLIAVGGAFGIECHALAMSQQPEKAGAGKEEQEPASPPEDNEGKPAAVAGATCRPLANVFRGQLVVAIAFSPDSGLMAAATMSGHVKVWDVPALVVLPPPPPPQPLSRQSKGLSARKKSAERGGGRGGGKNRGSEDVLRMIRPRPGQGGYSDVAALWGVALPMARVTSLAFSPDDNASFALACWDGKFALFSRAGVTEATETPPNASISDNPKNDKREGGGGGGGGSNDVGVRHAWKHVWREAVAAPAPPSKARGGKGGENLEDQDGAFLCWCRRPAAGPGVGEADLAVSSYRVTAGDCLGWSREEGGCGPEDRAASSSADGAAVPAHTTLGAVSPCEPSPSSGVAVPPATVTGPGFEIFAGHGLGERVGGAVPGSHPPGMTSEPTAERYLIHGLAAGPSFLALYDSDLCLHVVSIAAMLSAGRVLPPPPPPPCPVDVMGAFPLAEKGAAQSAMPSPSPATVKLVSNDHGLVAACVRRRRGSEDVDSAPPPDNGLELLVTWRNTTSGAETPDNGECAGGVGGDDNRRLPFLPGELDDDGGGEDGGGNGGVFGADVRWGIFALFTRYTVLVYTRPGRVETASVSDGVKGGDAPAVKQTTAGDWRAYAEHPVVHGLLLGGASTATPLSQRLPEPPADLADIYLLTVLGADAGGGDVSGRDFPSLSIRSLGDRNVACRCPLTPATVGEGEAKSSLVGSGRGVRVYASPGYGGGVFIAAAEGGRGECARVWRGTFDEGSCRLDVGPSRVITSHPWPEPETLRLQGVAGPNCELFLFKEETSSNFDDDAGAGGSDDIRWWITWPEAEIWRWVDAPALLGDEPLGVSDFVKIFQLEVEEMMSSYSRP